MVDQSHNLSHPLDEVFFSFASKVVSSIGVELDEQLTGPPPHRLPFRVKDEVFERFDALEEVGVLDSDMSEDDISIFLLDGTEVGVVDSDEN